MESEKQATPRDSVRRRSCCSWLNAQLLHRPVAVGIPCCANAVRLAVGKAAFAQTCRDCARQDESECRFRSQAAPVLHTSSSPLSRTDSSETREPSKRSEGSSKSSRIERRKMRFASRTLEQNIPVSECKVSKTVRRDRSGKREGRTPWAQQKIIIKI